MSILPHPQIAAFRIKKISHLRPTLAVLLGSGFHSVVDAQEVDAQMPYRSLPGFPATGIGGHAGKLLFCKVAGTPVLVLCGRAHYYEGWTR